MFKYDFHLYVSLDYKNKKDNLYKTMIHIFN